MARIGIIDDSAEMRAALRLVLELDHHDIWEASDGAQALSERLGADDILILDARMPGVDGFAVLEALAERGAEMPQVIMLSAEASLADRRRAEAAGAAAYLTKPFDVVELLSLVEGLASEHPG